MAEPIAMRPFESSLPMALLRAREASMRLFRPLLAEHGLTEQQWRVLRAVAASDEPLEIGEIAGRTLLLGPSLARILPNLARAGLLDRRIAAHDQRRVEISLTDAGRNLVATIAPRSELQYERIEAHIGAERMHQLMQLLDQIADIEPDPTMRHVT